jgi:hypothetical protein
MYRGFTPRKLKVVVSEATGVPGDGNTVTGYLYAASARDGTRKAAANRTMVETLRPRIRPAGMGIGPFLGGWTTGNAYTYQLPGDG